MKALVLALSLLAAPLAPPSLSSSPPPSPRPRAPQAPESPAGRLAAPEAAGRPAERVTARENDPLVKALEGRLRCTCGCNLDVFTCRTTDFACSVSPAMHQLVLARLDSGLSEEQVIAAFEAQYGEAVLMAPPKRGFNWAAYLVPFFALAAGGGVVTALIRGWFRPPRSGAGTSEPGTAPAAEGPVPGPTEEELTRLRRALEDYEA